MRCSLHLLVKCHCSAGGFRIADIEPNQGKGEVDYRLILIQPPFPPGSGVSLHSRVVTPPQCSLWPLGLEAVASIAGYSVLYPHGMKPISRRLHSQDSPRQHGNRHSSTAGRAGARLAPAPVSTHLRAVYSFIGSPFGSWIAGCVCQRQ